MSSFVTPPSAAPFTDAQSRPVAIGQPVPNLCPRWRSSDLLVPGTEAEIEHGGQIYRLRITSLGTLILTQ